MAVCFEDDVNCGFYICRIIVTLDILENSKLCTEKVYLHYSVI